MSLDSSIVVCAHNEENYVKDCLESILRQTVRPLLIIFVADRCNDKTEDIARAILADCKALIITKTNSHWKNNIAENLELARQEAQGVSLAVVDADMVIPSDFLQRLLPQLKQYASVSAVAKTDPSRGLVNRLVSIWEMTYKITPLGEQPRGGARVISTQDLEAIGGFRDVIAWDSDIDMRLRKSGFKVRLDTGFSVLHRRKMSLRRSVSYQIRSGRARRELGVSLTRTFLHSLFRLRPFVVWGYLKAADAYEKSFQGGAS